MNIKGPLPPGATDIVKPVSAMTGTGIRPQAGARNTVNHRAIQALLQVGQMLNAVVLKATASGALLQVESSLLGKDAPQLRLWTQPPVPLKEGQRVAMQVQEVAGKQPQLRLMDPVNETRQFINQHLAAAQVRQRPLPPLLANIGQLNAGAGMSAASTSPALNSDVVERVQALWRQIPERAQLTGAPALKQALKNAGPFLEATLAQIGRGERAFPAMDLRAGLLHLAATLRNQLSQQPGSTTSARAPANHILGGRSPVPPAAVAPHSTDETASATRAAGANPTAQPQPPAPPQPQARHSPTLLQLNPAQQVLEELSAQVEGALARIQTHQLQSLSSDAQRPMWHLELPVRDEQQIDLFDMRIQRDGGRDTPGDEARHSWSVTLAFDLEGLGPLRVQVQLQGGRVATHWWAEQPQTTELFSRYKDILTSRLNGAGLDVDQIDCRCGAPRARQPDSVPAHHRIDQHV